MLSLISLMARIDLVSFLKGRLLEFQNNENFIIYRSSMILQNECIAIMYVPNGTLIVNRQEKLDLMKNHLSFSI